MKPLKDKPKANIRVILGNTVDDKYEWARIKSENAPHHVLLLPLSMEARKELVASLLRDYNKILHPDQMAVLMENPASHSPQWLTLASEELRLFGVYEAFDEKIASLSSSYDGLIRQIVGRIAAHDTIDDTAETDGLCGEVLRHLYYSFNGLTADELRHFVGRSRTDSSGVLPYGHWAVIHRTIRMLTTSNFGVIRLQSQVFKNAVADQFCTHGEVMVKGSPANTMVLKMVEYFETCGNRDRVLEEYSHHVAQIRDSARIRHVRFGTGGDDYAIASHTVRPDSYDATQEAFVDCLIYAELKLFLLLRFVRVLVESSREIAIKNEEIFMNSSTNFKNVFSCSCAGVTMCTHVWCPALYECISAVSR
eukprot:m.1020871 g.1020871  ORF g.1020871 m.1020871 type:complete len:365 (+) comp24093_c0_seq2:385-1479(+)